MFYQAKMHPGPLLEELAASNLVWLFQVVSASSPYQWALVERIKGFAGQVFNKK